MRTVIKYHHCLSELRITNYRILLQFKADINKTNKAKFSALQLASQTGRLEMVDLLLEAGAEKEQLTFQDPTLQASYHSFLIIFKLIV